MLAASIALVACGGGGGGEDEADAGPDAADLQAAGWVGGEPVLLSVESEALRAVFFLDFDDASASLARRLAELATKHPDLVLVGATKETNPDAAKAFRERTGFTGPVALGITADALDHYGVQSRPALRVVGTRGVVVGRDLITLLSRLGRDV